MIELRWVRSGKTTSNRDRLQWREVEYLPEQFYPTELVTREWTYVPIVVSPALNSRNDLGGFIDGNDNYVGAGDPVEYKFENHRRGILKEALQDGDAYVTWNDGSHATVKWCNLAKVI